MTDPSLARTRRARSWWVYCATVARFGLVVVWAWAGIAKFEDPDSAIHAVRAYEILPEALVRPFAWGLPFVELGLAGLLLFGLATRPAAWCSTLLLAMFVVALVSAWGRGLQIECGCFGDGGRAASDATNYALEISRDVLFAAMALLVALGPSTRLAVDNHAGTG